MSSLLSLGGWSIIPDLVTKHLLDFLYRTPLLSRFFSPNTSIPRDATVPQALWVHIRLRRAGVPAVQYGADRSHHGAQLLPDSRGLTERR